MAGQKRSAKRAASPAARSTWGAAALERGTAWDLPPAGSTASTFPPGSGRLSGSPPVSARSQLAGSQTASPQQPYGTAAGSPPRSPALPLDGTGRTAVTVQLREGVRHSGWLLKAHGHGPHRKWVKTWFYLLDDRLCFADTPGAEGEVRYVPLDRVPVRAMPRGYGPGPGVSLVEDRQVDRADTSFSSPGRRGCVFSVQCGTHTHFMAAESAREAKEWVDAITRTWVHSIAHPDRGLHGGLPGGERDLHASQALAAENATLRRSLESLTLRQDGPGGEYWRRWQEGQERIKALEGQLVERVPYDIQTITGKCKGAGTDARVWVEVFGQEAGRTSGELRLEGPPGAPRPFQRSATDTFRVGSPALGALRMVRVFHDNSGAAPGWFLDALRVRRVGDKAWTYFPCGRWLATDQDDGRVMRELLVGRPEKAARYRLVVVTSAMRGAGTAANVHAVLHGAAGDSSRHRLSKGPDDFERGASNEFVVEDKELGDLAALTIGHDNSGEGAAWHLDHVAVTHLDSGRQWLFVCRQWLDAAQGDGKIERRLPACKELPVACWYTLAIATSDLPGASTDADVFVALHGAAGDSARVRLPSQPQDFERGGRDTFKIEVPGVGKLEKLTIGHNNKGATPGWHLDHVEVTDDAGAVTYFPCAKWLARGQGDGLIQRTLLAAPRPAPGARTEYQLAVHTSDGVRGAGTDANVSVVLFGRDGDSGPQPLRAQARAFERGGVDTFRVACPSLGPLTLLRVAHDNTGALPGWHLAKVVVSCVADGSVTEFPCHRWLSKAEDDGAISRDLHPAGGGRGGARYRLTVTTGDVRGASTDARVACQLYGEAGSMGPLALENAKDNFQRGKVDVFEHEGADIGLVQKLRIWHDNSGAAPAWFLDTVHLQVTAGSRVDEYLFVCGEWLDKEAGLERTLAPGSASDPRAGLVAYRITTHTADTKGAGTDANVWIDLAGEAGASGWQQLRGGRQAFERGQVDSFEVKLRELGRLRSLTLKSDGAGEGASWLCDLVTVEHLPSKTITYFACGRWLSEEKGLTVQLAASSEKPLGGAGLREYCVEVVTGDLAGAGTDAAVSVDIRGAKGTSGPQVLSSGSRRDFERGHTNAFSLRLADLGPLAELTVWHDGAGAAPAWHLDLIIVTDVASGTKYYFPCGQWLDAARGLRRVLGALLYDPRADKTTYLVATHTTKMRNAGTDANVFIDLHGSAGASGRQPLKAPRGANAFESGCTAQFKLELKSVGELKEVVIGHDGSGLGAGWHLDLVVVTDTSTSQVWYCQCGQWLDKAQGDGATQRCLPASAADPRRAHIKYQVTAVTSDLVGASTDARVYLQLHGAAACTPKLPLFARGKADFERGATDHFVVEGPDVGALARLVVGHDNSGPSPSWHLDRLEVARPGERAVVFPCKRWLSVTEDDGLSERELFPGTAGGATKEYQFVVHTGAMRGADTDAGVYVSLRGGRGTTGRAQLAAPGAARPFERSGTDTFTLRLPDVGTPTELTIGHDGRGKQPGWFLELVEIRDPAAGRTWYCPCARWLDKAQDDGATERVLPVLDRDPRAAQVAYTITTRTSDMAYASTDAGVHIQLFGEQGASGRLALEPSPGAKVNLFERGQADTFVVKAAPVGRLQKIRIGHDNKGLGPGWHLADVTVADAAGAKTLFKCDQWLDKSKGDGLIERELFPYLPQGEEVEYEVVVEATSAPARGARSAPVELRLTMWGSAGQAGPASLPCSFTADDLESVRRIRTAHAGALTHIELAAPGLQAAGGQLGLAAVTITHLASGQSWYFYAHRHFNAKDGYACTLKPDTLVQYRLRVHTSNLPGAATDAPIWVLLYGAKNETRKLELGSAASGAAFAAGTCDEFLFEEVDVGQPAKLWIGHHNEGSHPAWHCAHVEVTQMATGTTTHFPCGRWFARDRDDGLTHRLLLPGPPPAPHDAPLAPQTTYTIRIATADAEGAGTDAGVVLEMHGADGMAGPLTFPGGGGHFQRGAVNAFTVEGDRIGDISKLVVWLNLAGATDTSWQCDHIRVTDQASGQQWLFRGQGLLNRSNGHRITLWRSRDEQGASPQQVQYEVTVHTSDLPGAGTAAPAHIVVYGDDGNTGKQALRPAAGAGFRRGATDVCAFAAANTGRVTRIRIGHEDHGEGGRWHLERVEVANRATGERVTFHCNAWLDASQPGGAERELILQAAPQEAAGEAVAGTCRYKVELHTSDLRGAGTSANAFLTLVGSANQAGPYELRNLGDNFQQNQTDVFYLDDVPDVGKILQAEVGHDGSGPAQGWHLAWLRVTNMTTGATATFQCHRWLDRLEDDGEVYRLLTAQKRSRDYDYYQSTTYLAAGGSDAPGGGGASSSAAADAQTATYDERGVGTGGAPGGRRRATAEMDPAKVAQPGYRVTFHTSPWCASSTNAQVFFQLIGEEGTSGTVIAPGGRHAFKAGRADTFVFPQLASVGPLRQLRVGTDGAGLFPAWHLRTVEVTHLPTNRISIFGCYQYIDKKCSYQRVLSLEGAPPPANPPQPAGSLPAAAGAKAQGAGAKAQPGGKGGPALPDRDDRGAAEPGSPRIGALR